MKSLNVVLLAFFSLSASSVNANVANAEKLVSIYTAIAKHDNPEYTGPNAADGKLFFNRKIKLANVKEMTCASCHTTNPANEGKHIATGMVIRPLSPLVNAKRFEDIEKAQEKFTRHCIQIIGSDCTAAEKSSYISYLLTESTPSTAK